MKNILSEISKYENILVKISIIKTEPNWFV